jgi:citrate lyase gamma subunit
MASNGVSSNLATRLQDIEGVASVVVDLDQSGGGISVRLKPGANEAVVMEKLRSLLVTYGVRSGDRPRLKLGRTPQPPPARKPASLGVEVRITPLSAGGTRVEVQSPKVKSFRVVPSTASAITQGLSDAWCQVLGRIPVEIVSVSVDDSGLLTVVASDGKQQTEGRADVSAGWSNALVSAVGMALGLEEPGVSQPRAAVGS